MQTDFVRAVSIFKNLSEEEIETVGKLWEFRVIPAHQCIVAEGSPMHEFYLVVTGMVHVRRSSRGHNIFLAAIGEGGFFGDINLFDEATATASIHSMDKEVHLAVVANKVFCDFMNSQPETGYKITTNLLREVFRRLRKTDDRLVTSAFWG
jgi:CRP/FNR family transcriptional regulator